VPDSPRNSRKGFGTVVDSFTVEAVKGRTRTGWLAETKALLVLGTCKSGMRGERWAGLEGCRLGQNSAKH
jgi:hypothetical protein